MILDRILNFFTSLRLTVVCLCVALVLVLVGTLAQVEEGLYAAQNRYFRSLFIYWTPKGADWGIPVFPGGYLVGGVLLINLLAAHAKRFQFTRKKIGIFIIHGGIILLLLGQFATDLLSTESAMRLEEGESKNYSENGRESELVFIDASDPQVDEVIAIPQGMLNGGRELRPPKLPFTVRVKEFLPNSNLSQAGEGERPAGDHGAGARIVAHPLAQVTDMDSRDMPSAIVELVSTTGSLGTWLVSVWLDKPQTITVGSKSYQMAQRFTRYYKPFSLELLKFSHDLYKGTDTPKNFSSRVRLRRPDASEDREVLIYMNNPLRVSGETYYQAGFAPDNDKRVNKVTILQVVRNPSWLTPYFACVLVGVGLTVQFTSHLIAFARKRRTT